MSAESQSLDHILDGEAKGQAETQPRVNVETAEPAETKGETALAEPPSAQALDKTGSEDGGLVPLKVAQDERRKRQELERRLADLEKQLTAPKQEPKPQDPAPDWFVDPEGAAGKMYQQLEYSRLNDRANFSERVAVKTYGKELIDEVKQAVATAGVARHFFINSPDPYDDAVQWYKKQKIVSEIGDDPEAYRAKLREQVLAEMGQQNGSQPQGQAVATGKAKAPVPKSLAGVPGAQPRDDRGSFANPPSLSEILD